MCVLLSKGSLLQFMAVTHFRSGRDAAPLISCLASSPRYKGRRHSTVTDCNVIKLVKLRNVKQSKELIRKGVIILHQ